MVKANGLDRALLHGLHLRLGTRSEPVSDAALSAVVRVAMAYTSTAGGDESASREAVQEFDEDSLALVDVLTRAVLQLKRSDRDKNAEQYG